MAYTTPYTFVALSLLTAAQLNAMQANLVALWPFTAAGDLPYASSASTLAALAKGTSGQILKMGASVPEWGDVTGSSVLIEEHLVSAATEASIVFSAISGAYRHLRLSGQIRSNAASLGDNLLIRFNADTGANYDVVGIITGSTTQYSAGATSGLIAPAPGTSADASKVLTFDAEIPYYSKTTWYKNILSKSGKMPSTTANQFELYSYSSQWRNTGAITSITLVLASGAILQNSIVALYGIT